MDYFFSDSNQTLSFHFFFNVIGSKIKTICSFKEKVFQYEYLIINTNTLRKSLKYVFEHLTSICILLLK